MHVLFANTPELNLSCNTLQNSTKWGNNEHTTQAILYTLCYVIDRLPLVSVIVNYICKIRWSS